MHPTQDFNKTRIWSQKCCHQAAVPLSGAQSAQGTCSAQKHLSLHSNGQLWTYFMDNFRLPTQKNLTWDTSTNPRTQVSTLSYEWVQFPTPYYLPKICDTQDCGLRCWHLYLKGSIPFCMKKRQKKFDVMIKCLEVVWVVQISFWV